MGVYRKTLLLSLAKCFSALLQRNSLEGHHLYQFNTMKPINPPPSLSTGRTTSVLLLLLILWKKNQQEFDITNSDSFTHSPMLHVAFPCDNFTSVFSQCLLTIGKKYRQKKCSYAFVLLVGINVLCCMYLLENRYTKN